MVYNITYFVLSFNINYTYFINFEGAKTTSKPNEIQLNCHDETSFYSVQSFLVSIKDKVGYYTHALPSQRILKIVIKGIPLDITNQEITEELEFNGKHSTITSSK